MAETLLIVFIVFILLGMPISIAMAVGTLAAALFFPILNPIILSFRSYSDSVRNSSVSPS